MSPAASAWICLLVAGLFEVVWASGLKSAEGFTKLWPSVGVLAAMAVSVGLLAIAMKRLPAGTAYAVWTGIGAAGTAIVGVLWMKEPATFQRMACVALIVIGAVGLKASGE